jgi:rhodanese-related sulfurtransferase
MRIIVLNQISLYLLLNFLLTFSNLSAQDMGKGRIEVLDNKAFETKLIHERGVLVDLRSEAEIKDGIIKGARRAEWPGSEFEKMTERFYKMEPVFLYCAGGYRSQEAAEWLIKKGFLNVKLLENGFDGWNQEGYAIHDQQGKPIRAKKEAEKTHPASYDR